MRVIGLISGTSIDGIDTALVEIQGTTTDLKVDLIKGETYPYQSRLREEILAVCAGKKLSMEELTDLDDAIAYQFAQAAQEIEEGEPIKAELIGSHGQTVFHRPPQGKAIGYSLQLGRGEIIAQQTKRPTVNQFRQADVAAGGQGAPLVCKVDAYLLSHQEHSRCVQNIGGIGNLTYLPPRQSPKWEEQILGWDTGPGNVLIDLAVMQLTEGQESYDKDGKWSAQGTPCVPLITQWLEEGFFRQSPPKSTGRELFGSAYLERCKAEAEHYQLSSADWLATLTELTVESMVLSYKNFLPELPSEVLLCGGGSRNLYLKKRLGQRLAPKTQIITTDDLGMNADYKEAIAFAVLAYWRFIVSVTGNLPQVTGAHQAMLLGQIHLPVI